ncbi:hypothetical protein UMZ34_07020 [Halopseudomonas pachastrellae]|nr:hypothetical protein UMZ34_07020 [Halopseudomonas pachastrellae]
MVNSLQQQFPLPLPALTEVALSRASEPCRVLLLVNIGLDPLPGSSQKNLPPDQQPYRRPWLLGLRAT